MKANILLSQLLNKSRLALSKSITLIESSVPAHMNEAEDLLKSIAGERKSLRIGVCGPPGAGKSSMLDALGFYGLSTDTDSTLAVLTIDPSSVKSGGSILGDKTRMRRLVGHPRCYIRPSPSKGTFGGVTASCSEAMAL
jgi:LAO/AO transport system kinase